MAGPMGWTERELVERTAWMRRLARGLTRDAAEADDLVQEAWVAALEGGERPRSPRAWFRAVLGKRLSSERRARGRRADRERSAARREGLPPADEAAQRVELQERLARAVFALEEPYRQALALRYFQAWPPRRIAAELELDVRAVESRLRRGLEQLRRALDAQHGGRREEWFGGLVALGGGASLWKPATAAALVLALAAGGAVTAAARRGSESAAGAGVPFPGLAAAAPAGPRAGSERADVARPGAAASGPRVAAPAASAQAIVTLLREGDDAPLAGAEVLTGSASWTADRAGAVRIPWPEARALAVSATGRTRDAEFRLEGPGEHRLRVPRRGGALSGLVVDLEDRPVPGAEVRFFLTLHAGRSVQWEAPARIARADGRGRFAADDLADARGRFQQYRVLASAPGFFSACATAGAVLPADNAPALLVVEPVREVAGRVAAWDRPRVPQAPLLAYPRNPASFERVTALLEERNASGARTWGQPDRFPALFLHADEDGAFRLPVSAEPWHLQVDHRDYPQWRGWIEDQTFVDVFLDGGLALTGQVSDAAGQAVPEAEVKLHSEDRREPVRTDSAGRFRFEALSPLAGALVAVTAAGHACAVVPVDLEAGENKVEVRLERERVVSGRLLDAAGNPVAGEVLDIEGDRVAGTVWLPRSRGTTWEQLVSPLRWRASTDADGRFEFRGLYPGEFRVKTGPGRTAETWARVPAAGAPFVLVVGDRSGSLTVRGSVALPDGEVPGPADVLFQPFVEGETEPGLDLVGGALLSDGRFEFAGLDPGRWRLEVRSPDRSPLWSGPIQALGPGVHTFEVVLEPSGEVVLEPTGR